MRKRLTALLCVMTLLLCLFPQAAFAAGGLEGVDYSRIGGSGSRVTLTLGELTFEGELSRGSILSDSEQDAIIKQAMNELKITSGMLLNAKSMLDAAHKLQGFGMEDVQNALLKLTGAETTVDLYKHVMGTGNKTSEQIAADIAKGHVMDAAEKTLEDVLTQGGKVALQGGGKYAFKLLFLLPDLTEIGLDALAKYENIKETVAVALERQLLLDAFYDTVNQRIAQQSGDRGAWEVRFDGRKNYRTYNCTFWGISGVMMSAELSGVLEQVSEIDGAAGMYRGTLWLDLAGVDMANSFDEKFSQTGIFKVMLDGLKGMLLDGEAQDQYSETVLSVQTQSEISVIITAGGGTQTSEVSGQFRLNNEDIEFSFDHNLLNDLSGTEPGHNDIHVNEYLSYHLTSSDINSLTQVNTIYTEMRGPFGYYDIIGSKTPTDPDTGPAPGGGIGTVWKPLESKPSITVYFGS